MHDVGICTTSAEAGGWGDTSLPPPGRWADVLAPGRQFEGHVRARKLFARLPVAQLERIGRN